MTSATESFRIAYRVRDKQFVVRDQQENDMFAGNYRAVESWLDQRENSVSPFSESTELMDSETDAANALLKATMLTQEMVEKALTPDPKPRPKSLHSRIFGRKQNVKQGHK